MSFFFAYNLNAGPSLIPVPLVFIIIILIIIIIILIIIIIIIIILKIIIIIIGTSSSKLYQDVHFAVSSLSHRYLIFSRSLQLLARQLTSIANCVHGETVRPITTTEPEHNLDREKKREKVRYITEQKVTKSWRSTYILKSFTFFVFEAES